MQGPQWIPSLIVVSGASWKEHGPDMEEVVRRYPDLFRDEKNGRAGLDYIDLSFAEFEGEEFIDSWGCVWSQHLDGLEGIVSGHPLAEWENLTDFTAPDPLLQADRGPANWPIVQEEVRKKQEAGEAAGGGPPHGFFFNRLSYLRGFENLMVDMAIEEERLPLLIDKVMQHNRVLVEKWISCGVDVLEFADDLGTQTASMISPRMFRLWLAPHYQELMAMCRRADVLCALHSDGYIMNLMDDLLAMGVDIINPQDLVNGIDELANEVKGRMCIRLDVDRQRIVPYGTRTEIRALIEEEVRKLGHPRGGLEFIVGIYPPTTPDRVDAVASALEEFRTYWWDGRGR